MSRYWNLILLAGSAAIFTSLMVSLDDNQRFLLFGGIFVGLAVALVVYVLWRDVKEEKEEKR